MLTLHSPDAHLTIPQPLPELKPSTALFSYCFHTVVNTAAGTQSGDELLNIMSKIKCLSIACSFN